MVPGHPRVLAKMLTPRRFRDPNYAASIAGELYGGKVQSIGDDVAQIFLAQLHAGSRSAMSTNCSRGRSGQAFPHCL